MTLDLLADVATGVLVVAGSFFLIVGAYGMLRMPDVFTRMHAVSVSDTLGAGFLILAMIIQAGFSLVTVKLLIILAVFFFTSPLSTHALTRAALAAGIEPVLLDRQGRRRRKELGLIGEFIGTQDREIAASAGARKPPPAKKAASRPGKGARRR